MNPNRNKLLWLHNTAMPLTNGSRRPKKLRIQITAIFNTQITCTEY